MTSFDRAHLGDRLQIVGIRVSHFGHDESWSRPLLLIREPVPCGDGKCEALTCDALTPDGKTVHLHLKGLREVHVLEYGPASELATPRGDVLAEHADKPTWAPWTDPDYRQEQADYEDTPNDEGEQH